MLFLALAIYCSLFRNSIKFEEIRFFSHVAGLSYCNNDTLTEFTCLEHCNDYTKHLDFIGKFKFGKIVFVALKNRTNLFFSFEGTVDYSGFLMDVMIRMVPLHQDHLLSNKNSKARLVRVHYGFQIGYMSAREIILNITRNYNLPVILVGHSLGGGLASLAALEISAIRGVQLVTIGSPRVGNSHFASLLSHKVPSISRITNRQDITPLLPSSLLGYRHPPREIYISRHNLTIYCDYDNGEDMGCIRSAWPRIQVLPSHVYVFDIHVGLSC